MTRLGWGILVAIVVVIAGFASVTRFGTIRPEARMARGTAMPSPGAAAAATSPGRLVVPVAGVARAALRDNWGDPREGGARAHHGLDIPAAAGTAVLAAAPGRVEKLFQSGRGGTTLYVRSTDGGTVYYYAHLAGYAPGITEGRIVRAGETIAFVGDSGDAGPGNYHLHFGVQRMAPGMRWWQGEDVDPYPILAAGTAPR